MYVWARFRTSATVVLGITLLCLLLLVSCLVIQSAIDSLNELLISYVI
jgi:hypothetical protein